MGHAGKTPAVIGMHHDEICFDPGFLQLCNAVLDPAEMLRIESGLIKMVSSLVSVIIFKICICQNAGVHWGPFVRIAVWLIQIVVEMLRENAETQFVEACLPKGRQRLGDQFIGLMVPDVAGGSHGIIRRSVFISEMIIIRNSYRAMIVFRRFCRKKTPGHGFRQEIRGYSIMIFPGKRRHEPDFINAFSIIKTLTADSFSGILELPFQMMLCKRIPFRRSFKR